MDIEDPKQKSNAEKLRQRMSNFLEDVRREENITRKIEVSRGMTWEEKVSFTCSKISMTRTDQIAQLPSYYSLGALLEEKAWSKEAKGLVQRILPTKFQDTLFIAQRAYLLYTTCGPSHLFTTQHITPYALLRLYKEDFLKLREEAQSIVQQELTDVLRLTNFAGAQ